MKSTFTLLRRQTPALLAISAIALVDAMMLAIVATTLTAAEPEKLPPAAKEKVDFDKHIKPIFEKHCYGCHGPEKQESGLRLDFEAGAKEGEIGPTYVAGKSADSPIVAYVAGTDSSIVMPPPDSRVALLSKDQVALLRAWIDQGAHWPKVDSAPAEVKPTKPVPWSFTPPTRSALPTVKNREWVKNPIDGFILARLEQAGLSPEAEADRETLIRRVSLDLTGLPPTPEEVQAFVNDQSPDAYQTLVERLLESPHYGERWALWWLDLARYADTNGYEVDRTRSIWPYRDWVISAFNANMPFNQFTIEQIAGDMLPGATLSQKVATGFHRNTYFNEEGGHDWEQFRWESIVDRVSTTGSVFLGLSIGCAQCHDHKYDPISQREFYEFFALLNNADEPHLEVPQPEITSERRRILDQIAELESQLECDEDAFTKWVAQAAKEAKQWVVLEPLRWTSKNNQTLTPLEDGSLLASGDRPEVDLFDIVYRSPLKKITGIKLEAIPDPSLPNQGPGRGYFHDDGTFLISEISMSVCEADSKARENQPVPLVNPSATHSKGKSTIDKAIDGEKLTGWHISKGAGRRHCAVFETKGPVEFQGNGEVTLTLLQNFVHAQTIGRFRMWVTSDEGPLTANLMPHKVETILLKSPAAWSADERETVKRYYLLSVATEQPALRRRIEKLRRSLPEQPTTLVMQEREHPRTTYQAIRGDSHRRGPEVTPNVPRLLHPLPQGVTRDRLALARWLVDEKNPLVGRVIMNQIWQCYFGRGLVNTPDDFGNQGEQPSHPELLDWLACEFMDSGWDLRHMHRLIVTSAAYRQSSEASDEKLQKDPENVLVSRGARFRLPGEFIRDVALKASGLLNTEVGGPSVFPPQPEGVTDVIFNDKFKWETSQGPDRYRRGLYTFRKRGAMYPAFAVFDAPPQATCTLRRNRSNTPLQALNLLNDEAMIEAAQALSQQLLASEARDDAARLELAFMRCLSRSPQPQERQSLVKYLDTQRRRFEKQKPEEVALIGGVEREKNLSREAVVEHAAWTMVARVLFNLDETISKE